MNKKVLIVTSEFPPQPGGIGNHAYYLARYLCKSGFLVSVIADQRAKDNSEENHFDSKLPFTVIRIKLTQWRLPMYLMRIVRTFRHIWLSDFVIATGKFSLWNVAFCTRFLRRSNMAIIHGSEVNFKSVAPRIAINMALKKFNTIVAVSSFTKDLVSHLNRDIQVIPNGIENKKWQLTKNVNTSLGGTPNLITVGRVSDRKGQLQVIEHLPNLIKTFPKLHYHCVGIPSQAEAFLKVAKSLGVDSYITFHGAINNSDLKELLCLADIFIMLSKETQNGDVEGFGIAILEANAIGIPAIGSKNCGIVDAIDDGNTGCLVDYNNTNDLINAFNTILTSKTTFKNNAIKWARAHDWSIIIERYINLIK